MLILAGCGFSSKWIVPIEQNDYATLEKNITEGNIADRDGEGYTPLHHAARFGNLKAIKLLIEAGADVHAYPTNRILVITPLSLALKNNQYDAAKKLIDLGAADFIKSNLGSGVLSIPADAQIVSYSRFETEAEKEKYLELLQYIYKSGFQPTFQMIEDGYLSDMTTKMLKTYLEFGGKKFINTWIKGSRNTALFNQTKPENIKLLIKYGADPLLVNVKGNTPFHHAIDKVAQRIEQSGDRYANADEYYIGTWLKPLLDAGLNPFVENNQGKTVLEYANQVANQFVISELKVYEKNYAMREEIDGQFESCEKIKDLEARATCYQTFASSHTDHVKVPLAQKRFESLNKKRLVILEKNKKNNKKLRAARVARQACKLKNQDWEYLSKACKGGYAQGQGQAINEEKSLKFVGQFKAGLRIQGEIFAFGKLMYDGPLKNDRPHGKGICMHEGEPEDCNYYKGKRTDVLYKQRIEFAKQREMLASTEKRINQSLKETESNIDEKLANIQVQSGTGYQGASAQDLVMDAVKKKAAEEAADFLFDQLF